MYCIAYRNNIASRRNIQTHQEPDEDTFEVQVNITEDNEDLNMNPESEKWTAWSPTNIVELTEVPNSDSEELKSTNSIDPSKGKPRCIILLFQIMQLIIILLVHLSYWSWMKTLDA